MSKKKTPSTDNTIVLNKKARHDYFIEDTYEAGIVLEGWEVKSLRAKSIQVKESYIILKAGEAWLQGAHISPLPTASTHIKPDPVRPRKLLLHRTEIDRMIGAVERKGYTIVPVKLDWIRGRAKVQVGVAKGKQQHDKRNTEKDRDWDRQKSRILKHND
jgi:SsrA-binding protein